MQKANQKIVRFNIITPKDTKSEDIVNIINAIKSDTVSVPVSQKTYEIRRKQASPFFRMFIKTPETKKDIFNIYGKNIFRLFS